MLPVTGRNSHACSSVFVGKSDAQIVPTSRSHLCSRNGGISYCGRDPFRGFRRNAFRGKAFPRILAKRIQRIGLFRGFWRNTFCGLAIPLIPAQRLPRNGPFRGLRRNAFHGAFRGMAIPLPLAECIYPFAKCARTPRVREHDNSVCTDQL